VVDEDEDLDLDLDEDDIDGETDEERAAREELDIELDEESQAFVDFLVDKLMLMAERFSGHTWYKYQRPFAMRIFESVIIEDGATLTALYARQSGKSETVANCIATCMIMLPILARVYPFWLERFSEGVWVGAFAPVDGQADTLFTRIIGVLESEAAAQVFADPDFSASLYSRGKVKGIKFQGMTRGSIVRKTTCHPRATIEGDTYHIILIDECFPEGTPILTKDGWVDIKEIVDHPEKNWIVAAQGANDVDWAHVTAGYKTKRNNELVRVVHEHGTLYSTANHPFMVGGKKVPASLLRPGQELSLVQTATEHRGSNSSEEVQEANRSGVLQLTPSTAEESFLATGEQGQDFSDSSSNWTSPYSPWGERYRTDESTTAPERLARAGMEARACSPNWRKSKRRASSTLQDRSGESLTDASNRSGWGVTRDDSASTGGSSEDTVVVQSRVVSVEIVESGSSEFDQFADGAEFVYTLEVDHPSHTYNAAGVFVGNCQGANDQVVNKSIEPMGTSTGATMIFTGTCTYNKNVFYNQIQINKREATKRGRSRVFHFEVDWKMVARENKRYGRSVKKAMIRIGEDSDEFKLSYRLIWLLDRGMFTTNDKLDKCGDKSMQLVPAWTKTPVVVGIDPARIQDKTIVTVLYVDWDHPDDLGYYHHRVLNWLDLEGLDWEVQYYKIVEFLSNYNVWKIGVDSGGVGDAVAQRLQILMPATEVIPLGSASTEQSIRWKYLRELIDRTAAGATSGIVWPAHSKVKRLKTWKRFRQEMEDLEISFKGPHMQAEAPHVRDAHDDYADSLSMACILSQDHEETTVEVYSNMFYSNHGVMY
jgi:hypothetical protein